MSVIEDMRSALREAVRQAELAYEFHPGSYNFHALLACRRALTEVTRDVRGVHWIAARMVRKGAA